MLRSVHSNTRLQSVFLVLVLTLSVTGLHVSAQQPWPEVSEFDEQYAIGAAIHDIEWNPDGQVLGVAAENGLWLLDADLQPIVQVHGSDLIRALSWSPGGDQVAITFRASVEIWQWDGSVQMLTYGRSLASNVNTYGVFWSPDGQRIASLEIEEVDYVWLGRLHIWRTTTWESERIIDGKFIFELEDLPTVQRFVWSPDGSPLLAGVGIYARVRNETLVVAIPASIYVINIETGEQDYIPLIVDDIATSLDWQPGSNLIAVGTRYGSGIYNLETGQFVGGAGTPLMTYTVRWDPSGNYIATGTGVARADTRSLLGQFLTGFAGKVVDWKPDGLTLTVADFRGVITNWNANHLPNFVPEPPQPTLTPLPTDTPATTNIPLPTVTNTPTATLTPTLTPTPSQVCDFSVAAGDALGLVNAVNTANNNVLTEPFLTDGCLQ